MPIMGITTLIVTSSANPILITHVEICTNLDTNAISHKHADAMETLSLKTICMREKMTIKFSRGSISKCDKCCV